MCVYIRTHSHTHSHVYLCRDMVWSQDRPCTHTLTPYTPHIHTSHTHLTYTIHAARAKTTKTHTCQPQILTRPHIHHTHIHHMHSHAHTINTAGAKTTKTHTCQLQILPSCRVVAGGMNLLLLAPRADDSIPIVSPCIGIYTYVCVNTYPGALCCWNEGIYFPREFVVCISYIFAQLLLLTLGHDDTGS